jgi:hypothetical protein
MPDTKISAMTAATTPLTGAELVPLIQGGANVKSTTLKIASIQTVSSYTDTSTSLSGFSHAHGLGAAPSYVRAVLLCIAPDIGTSASAGVEIDLASTMLDSSSPPNPVYGWGADTTNLYFFSTGSYPNLVWVNSLSSPSNLSNFRVKIYYRL